MPKPKGCCSGDLGSLVAARLCDREPAHSARAGAIMQASALKEMLPEAHGEHKLLIA